MDIAAKRKRKSEHGETTWLELAVDFQCAALGFQWLAPAGDSETKIQGSNQSDCLIVIYQSVWIFEDIRELKRVSEETGHQGL